MKLIERLLGSWAKRRTERAAASIRASMAAFGYDVSAHSDDEIADACQRLGEVAKASGFTAAQLSEACRAIGQIEEMAA